MASRSGLITTLVRPSEGTVAALIRLPTWTIAGNASLRGREAL